MNLFIIIIDMVCYLLLLHDLGTFGFNGVGTELLLKAVQMDFMMVGQVDFIICFVLQGGKEVLRLIISGS